MRAVVSKGRRVCASCLRIVSGRCPCELSGSRRYPGSWVRAAKAAIARSPVCVDCGATNDLTGDHVVPRSKGGTERDGIVVRCRSCDARRGARPGHAVSRAPMSALLRGREHDIEGSRGRGDAPTHHHERDRDTEHQSHEAADARDESRTRDEEQQHAD